MKVINSSNSGIYEATSALTSSVRKDYQRLWKLIDPKTQESTSHTDVNIMRRWLYQYSRSIQNGPVTLLCPQRRAASTRVNLHSNILSGSQSFGGSRYSESWAGLTLRAKLARRLPIGAAPVVITQSVGGTYTDSTWVTVTWVRPQINRTWIGFIKNMICNI